MGIKFMAAQRGIAVRAISIDTEADWDAHPRQLIKGLAKKPKRLHLKLRRCGAQNHLARRATSNGTIRASLAGFGLIFLPFRQ